MGMIEGRRGPDAHEFTRADMDRFHAGIVAEMGNTLFGHVDRPPRSARRAVVPFRGGP
jgi:hypothetical protein